MPIPTNRKTGLTTLPRWTGNAVLSHTGRHHEARVNEILAMWNQIVLSGYETNCWQSYHCYKAVLQI